MLLRESEDFSSNYIVVNQSKHFTKQCNQCENQVRQKQICMCKLAIYRVRPYTYEFLRGIISYFEIIIASNIPSSTLTIILRHLDYFTHNTSIKVVNLSQLRNFDHQLNDEHYVLIP